MKRISLIFLNTFLLLAMFCCRSTTGKHDDTRLIRFEYAGESDKPMPKFVFYTNGEFDTGRLGIFEEAFEIGQEDISKIANLIEDRFTDKPAQSNFWFQFTLSNKYKNKKLFSSDKTVMRNLLKDIAGILENKKENKFAENYIYEVIRRI